MRTRSWECAAFAFIYRREYEPFMLNGDAHHSLVWEVEPRILPLLNCQRRSILNDGPQSRK